MDIKPGTDLEQVKQRYLHLAKQTHPDRTRHLSEQEQESRKQDFQEIQDAYHAIMNGYQIAEKPNVQPEEDSKIQVIFPWLYILAFFGFVSYYFVSSTEARQQQANLLAHDLYNSHRRREGLDGIVGSRK